MAWPSVSRNVYKFCENLSVVSKCYYCGIDSNIIIPRLSSSVFARAAFDFTVICFGRNEQHPNILLLTS